MANKEGKRKAKATVNNIKQTHNDEPPQSHQKAAELNLLASMDDQLSLEEKFLALKSLNDKLIKQINEKRQQVDNDLLDQAKAELIRSKAEKTELRNELEKANEKFITGYASLKKENDNLLYLKSAIHDLKTELDIAIMEHTEEHGSESYEMEIDSIKIVFKNKEDTIKEMTNEVERLKQSLIEEHKKKSFWTLVSSVTMVVAAAVFIGYARKKHALIR